MRRVLVGFTLLASLLVVAWVASCSSKGGPTAPGTTAPPGELSGPMNATGSQYAHMFNAAGTFNYLCTIHNGCGGLHGTIVVVSPGTGIQNRLLALSIDGGSAGGVYVGATCSALSNARDTVHVGDQVTWTNNSTLAHNVTSY